MQTIIRNWILFGLIIIGRALLAQHEGNKLYGHELDEEKWESIREGIRYEGRETGPGRQWTYESNREYNEAKRKNGNGSGGGNGYGDGKGSRGLGNDVSEPPKTNSSPPPRSYNNDFEINTGLSMLGYILLALFLIGLVVLIYYMFVNTPKDGKKVGAAIELEELNPTEIPLTELQMLLQKALAKGDYRGAIRIYFIFIIRDLAQKNWIDWERKKTNFHYLREMAGKMEYDDFSRSVSYFEIIWYGKREIDADKFDQIKPNFIQFLDKLGGKVV